MTAPSDPHAASAPPDPANPSTQQIPVVPDQRPAEPGNPAVVPPDSPAPTPGTGPSAGTVTASRPAPLPAPGQRPPQPVTPGTTPPPVHPLQPPGAATGAQPVATPAPPAASPPPAWPDTLADDPAPQTRPATDAVAPTGPVDFVPGPPGAAPAAPPRPEKGRTTTVRSRSARDRSTPAGIGAAALAVLLLQFGLVHGTAELWSAVTLWSLFATAATVLVLLALVGRIVAGSRISPTAATRVAGAGVVGLAIFWLLVILPIVASDPGFLVTAALLAAGAALWIGPRAER